MFVFVLFFVSVSVIHVFVHLNLSASSILKCVCGWEVDWSDRQRQVANWNQSTISVVIIFIVRLFIIRPWPLILWRLINTVWMFLEISTYHESHLRLYTVARIIFGSVGVFILQTWQSYYLSLTQWSWIVVVWSGQPQAQLAKSKSVNRQPRQHRQGNQIE